MTNFKEIFCVNMIAYSQDFCHGEKCNVQISYLTIFLVCTLVDMLYPQKCAILMKDHYMNKQEIYVNKKSLWKINTLRTWRKYV